MQEIEAGEILEGEFTKAISAVTQQEGLSCTYAVHRNSHPPVPAVINEMNTQNSQGVRSMVRFLSDALSGEAVSLVAPIVVNSPQGEKCEAIVGAVSWREGSGTTRGRIQAVRIVRDNKGKVASTADFRPEGIEGFMMGVMEGVISPVLPDAHSIAYARGRLESNGFPPEVIGVNEDVGVPTVH